VRWAQRGEAFGELPTFIVVLTAGGIVAGAATGASQWAVLRWRNLGAWRIPRAWRWIAASTLGWGVAGAVAAPDALLGPLDLLLIGGAYAACTGPALPLIISHYSTRVGPEATAGPAPLGNSSDSAISTSHSARWAAALVAVGAAALLLAALTDIAASLDRRVNRSLRLSDRSSKNQALTASERVSPGMLRSEAIMAMAPDSWRWRACVYPERTDDAFYYGTRDEVLKVGVLLRSQDARDEERVFQVFMLMDELNHTHDSCPEMPLLAVG
jgi:hypothetical protein